MNMSIKTIQGELCYTRLENCFVQWISMGVSFSLLLPVRAVFAGS